MLSVYICVNKTINTAVSRHMVAIIRKTRELK